MKKRVLALVLALVLCISLLPTMALADGPTDYWTDSGNYDVSWYEGQGTSGSPKTYTLDTADELAGFAYIVNYEGDDTLTNSNGTYTIKGASQTFAYCTVKVSGEIDLAAHKWAPICDKNNYGCMTAFTGESGAIIKNVYIDSGYYEGGGYSGFFGITEGGPLTISNLTFDNVTNVVEDESAGIVNGCPSSALVMNNITVKNSTTAGGGILVGSTSGYGDSLTITNCTIENCVSASGYVASKIWANNAENDSSPISTTITGLKVKNSTAALNNTLLYYSLSGAYTVQDGWDNVVSTPVCFAAEIVGGEKYTTLAEAVTAAQGGDTIVLLKDVADVGTVSLPASVTLDGNGHQIITGNSCLYINTAGGTVKNVVFQGIGNTQQTLSAIYAQGLTGKLTVENCRFVQWDWDAIQVVPKDGAVIEIKDNYFEKQTDVNSRCCVHIQGESEVKPVITATITGNTFITNNIVASAAIWYASNDSTIDLSNNYFDVLHLNVALYDGNNKLVTDKCELAFPCKATEDAETATVNPTYKRPYDYGVEYYCTLEDAIKAGNVARIGNVVYETLAAAVAAVPENGSETTITMIGDETYDAGNGDSWTIPANKNVTLDLAGHTLTAGKYGFEVEGTLTVNDSSDGKTGVIQGQYAITVNGTVANLVLNAGTVIGKGASASSVGAAVRTSGNCHFTMNGGKLLGSGKAYTVTVNNANDAPTVTINKGELTAEGRDDLKANDAIYWASNGVVTIGTENGKNSDVIISTNNGNGIEAPCGTIVINHATITASESTFDSSDSIKAYWRSAGGAVGLGDAITLVANKSSAYAKFPLHVTIKDGVFTSSSDYALRYMDVNTYSMGSFEAQDVSVVVEGGMFKTTNPAVPRAVDMEYTTGKVLQGGVFSSKPDTAYVADDYAVMVNDDPNTKTAYPFKVDTPESGVTVAEVTTGETEAKSDVTAGQTKPGSDEKFTASEATAATEATTAITGTTNVDMNVTGKGVDVASTQVAQENTVTGSDTTYQTETGATSSITLVDAVNATPQVNSATANDIAIVVQTYTEVSVADVTLDEDFVNKIQSITYDIQPMIQKVATTTEVAEQAKTDAAAIVTAGGGQNAVKVGEPQKLVVTETTNVTIPLPAYFVKSNGSAYDDGEQIDIKHVKSDNSVYYYKGTITNVTDNYSVSFVNPDGFSTFTVMANADTTVSVTQNGNTVYFEKLQDAADYVVDGATVTLTAEGAENATIARNVSFTFNNGGFVDADIAAGTNYRKTVTINDTVITYAFNYVAPSDGGGVTTYTVSVESAANGKVTVDKASASAGSTVTVTATPDEGYTLSALTVLDKDGKEVEVKNVGDGKYRFTMPASDVTVSATFEKGGVCPKNAVCPIATFIDAKPTEWYHDGVHFCLENGYMNGVGNDQFAPNGTLSRAMIVTMLWRLEGKPVVNYAMSFKDVKADQWYTEAIRWAQSTGVVEGYNADSFGPDDDVTREQLATILYRYAKYKDIDTDSFTKDVNTLSYTDVFTISDWANAGMHFCIAAGVVSGNGDMLYPTNTATRAEAATMFQRFCEKVLSK